MGFMKRLRDILRKFDMFPATQFLRYKQQAQFKTPTGGFISIAILITFIVIFFSLALQTVEYKIIKGSVSYKVQVQPTPLPIKFTNHSEFMFSIGIFGLNLTNPSMVYFNITLKQIFYTPLMVEANSTTVPLVQCTAQHYSYNSDIRTLYDKFTITNALCPPLNFDFHVGGRVISDSFSRFQIYVQDCNSTVNPNCVKDQNITDLQKIFGGFRLLIPTTNTIINSQESQYKQVYLQDRNYCYFTTTAGVQLYGEIQQYQIDTDVSLMPYTDIRSQYVTVVPNLLTARPKAVTTNRYASVFFSKSSQSTLYTRKFNKLDQFLSYVGGLVGTTLIIFFILSSYSEKAFLFDIASQIYSLQEGGQKQQDLSFLNYMMIQIRGVINLFSKGCSWKKAQVLEKVLQQMQKQMCISYLLKKMNYFEDALSTVLSQHQAISIHLNEKKTISAATNSRKITNVSNIVFQKDSKIQGLSGSKLNLSLNQNDLSKQSPAVGQQNVDSQIIEPCNEEISSYDQGQKQKIKESLIQVIRESNQGDPISKRIIDKLQKTKIFERMGLLSLSQNLIKNDTEKNAAVSNEFGKPIEQVNDHFQYLQFQEIK